MVLRGLQSLLGRLYDVISTTTFTIFWSPTGARSQALLPSTIIARPTRSCCSQRPPTAPASRLYIDPSVLERLEEADPLGALTEDNLADYCTALEGVSHFVYSLWRLDGDAPVSLLELETQAEVDKYAATVFLVADQQGGDYPRPGARAALRSRQFRCPPRAGPIRPLSDGARSAANYCRRLESRFVSRGKARVEALVRELRKFYRLGSTAKLRYALS